MVSLRQRTKRGATSESWNGPWAFSCVKTKKNEGKQIWRGETGVFIEWCESLCNDRSLMKSSLGFWFTVWWARGSLYDRYCIPAPSPRYTEPSAGWREVAEGQLGTSWPSETGWPSLQVPTCLRWPRAQYREMTSPKFKILSSFWKTFRQKSLISRTHLQFYSKTSFAASPQTTKVIGDLKQKVFFKLKLCGQTLGLVGGVKTLARYRV